MDSALSLVTHVLSIVAVVGLFAAFDVGRREPVSAWWFLGLAVAWAARMAVWQVAVRRPSFGFAMFTEVENVAAVSVAVTVGAGAGALALSRSFRATPGRWRPWRMGIAILALAVIPVAVGAGDREANAALWLSWSALPVTIAFARSGDHRFDRGAAAALGLVWVGAGAWLIAGLLQELSRFLFSLVTGGWIMYPGQWQPMGLRIAWVVAWTTLTVGRWPDPRALVVGIPAALLVGSSWLELTRPNPVFAAGPTGVPQVVDLVGGPVERRLGTWWPRWCATNLAGDTVHVCPYPTAPHPWLLSPDLPLADAPAGAWVVYQPLSPQWLGYAVVDVTGPRLPTATGYRTLRIREEGGLAVVDDGPAVPLDRALMAELRSRPPPAPNYLLRIVIERTPRWTVQQALSICASAFTDGRSVDCLVVP